MLIGLMTRACLNRAKMGASAWPLQVDTIETFSATMSPPASSVCLTKAHSTGIQAQGRRRCAKHFMLAVAFNRQRRLG
jgi:hypothetical protein